jgi:uncharacterized protein (DUF934 family)
MAGTLRALADVLFQRPPLFVRKGIGTNHLAASPAAKHASGTSWGNDQTLQCPMTNAAMSNGAMTNVQWCNDQ